MGHFRSRESFGKWRHYKLPKLLIIIILQPRVKSGNYVNLFVYHCRIRHYGTLGKEKFISYTSYFNIFVYFPFYFRPYAFQHGIANVSNNWNVVCVFSPSSSWLSIINHLVRFTALSSVSQHAESYSMSWRHRVMATIYARWTSSSNSLVPGRWGYNIRWVSFKFISRINVLGNCPHVSATRSVDIASGLNQSWPRSMSPCGKGLVRN